MLKGTILGPHSLGPVLESHLCHVVQAVGREKWKRKKRMSMNENKPVDSKSPYGFGAAECSSGYHHGPHQNCKHKGSSDTSMEICQWPQSKEMLCAFRVPIMKTKCLRMTSDPSHLTWTTDVRPRRMRRYIVFLS